MKTKTINGMILDIDDTIASHLLKSNLDFYTLYEELRSNMGSSLTCNGIETMVLTDSSKVEIYIHKNKVILA